MLDRELAVTSLCVVMPPALAEQVITLMVAANDLTLVQAMREELMSRKTDLIIVACIFIGMVTFFAFMHLVDILRRMFCGVDCDSDRYGIRVTESACKMRGKTLGCCH